MEARSLVICDGILRVFSSDLFILNFIHLRQVIVIIGKKNNKDAILKMKKKIKYQLFHTSLRRFVHTGFFLLLNELDLYCQKIMTEYILF